MMKKFETERLASMIGGETLGFSLLTWEVVDWLLVGEQYFSSNGGVPLVEASKRYINDCCNFCLLAFHL
jgi:hypothetical protein